MRRARSVVAGLSLAVAIGASIGLSPAAAADASLRIEPASAAVADGQTFEVQVVQQAPVATSGAQVSVQFDPKILQLVSVRLGSAYSAAPIFLPRSIDASIRTANESGHLAQVAAAFTPPDAVAAGTASFLVVRFRAVGCGETDLDLPTGGPFNAQMISGRHDDYGNPVAVITANGHVKTCVEPAAATVAAIDPGQDSRIVLVIGVGAALALGAALIGAFAWRRRRPIQPLAAAIPVSTFRAGPPTSRQRRAARSTSHGGSMRRR